MGSLLGEEQEEAQEEEEETGGGDRLQFSRCNDTGGVWWSHVPSVSPSHDGEELLLFDVTLRQVALKGVFVQTEQGSA